MCKTEDLFSSIPCLLSEIELNLAELLQQNRLAAIVDLIFWLGPDGLKQKCIDLLLPAEMQGCIKNQAQALSVLGYRLFPPDMAPDSIQLWHMSGTPQFVSHAINQLSSRPSCHSDKIELQKQQQQIKDYIEKQCVLYLSYIALSQSARTPDAMNHILRAWIHRWASHPPAGEAELNALATLVALNIPEKTSPELNDITDKLLIMLHSALHHYFYNLLLFIRQQPVREHQFALTCAAALNPSLFTPYQQLMGEVMQGKETTREAIECQLEYCQAGLAQMLRLQIRPLSEERNKQPLQAQEQACQEMGREDNLWLEELFDDDW